MACYGELLGNQLVMLANKSSSSSAYVKHSVTTCGSKCNFNCYSSTFAILSTLLSLNSFVVTTIYMYIDIVNYIKNYNTK